MVFCCRHLCKRRFVIFLKMPFLSSLLNYLGGQDKEPKRKGEEKVEDTKSNDALKRIQTVEDETNLCNGNLMACDSNKNGKENEDICNLVNDNGTESILNGNEINTKEESKKINNNSTNLPFGNEGDSLITATQNTNTGEYDGQCIFQGDKKESSENFPDEDDTRNIVSDRSINTQSGNSMATIKDEFQQQFISKMDTVNRVHSNENSLCIVEVGTSSSTDTASKGPTVNEGNDDQSSDIADCTVKSIESATSWKDDNQLDTVIKSNDVGSSTISEISSQHIDRNYCQSIADHETSIDLPLLQNTKNCEEIRLNDMKDCQPAVHFKSDNDISNALPESKALPDVKMGTENMVSGENTQQSSLAGSLASDKKAAGKNMLDGGVGNGFDSEAMETDSNQGPSLVDESSNITTSSLNSIVTQDMVDVEEKYEIEDKAEDEKSRKKVVDNMRAAPEDERFNRLKNLLDRSNVYAQFLLKRMDQQREQEKSRREMKEKAKEKRDKKKEDNQVVPDISTHSTRSGQKAIKGSPLKTKSERKRKRKNESDEDIQEDLSKGKRKKLKNDDTLKAENDDNVIGKAQKNQHIVRKINGEVVSDRQPSLVTGGVMRSYQIDGMEWMRGLFENGINGILADEMGLGKTLQCISLLAYFVERGMKGPFLIAAPLSTLPNWVSEFKKFTPKVKTLLYHGSKDERLVMRQKILKLRMIDDERNIKGYPVVITSYEIIMRDRAFLNVYPWKYIIIDEGHRIKNLNCRLIRELKTYKTANRLLLTGTPLQNNLAELWSLLNFLLPDIFDDLNSFQEWFDFSAVSEDGGDEKLIAQEKEEHVLETLHAILTPFLLRRLKTDVDLTIPPKRELIVYAPLTIEQQEFYKGTLDKTILNKIKQKNNPVPVIEYTNSGRPKRRATSRVDYKSMLDEDDSETFDFEELLEKMTADEERKKADNDALKATSVVSVKLQNVLMQLRKCCNHPYLLEHPINPETQQYIIDESLVKVSGKMKLLDQMLPELKKQGHKVLIFSQMTKMLDIIEDFCYLRHYDFSRIDGTMKVPDRQEMIERFNNDPDVFLFLLSTRAGGLGLNLSSADTCIIYDSDWNPQVDLQAQDRCHRIGQTKPVLIFRFVTANSIDERVVDRAASKRKLEKMVIHKGRFKGKEMSSKLSTQDLLELLQSKDHSHVSNIGDDIVISEESLHQMLDRSSLLHSKPEALEKGQTDTDLFKVVEQSQEDALF